jgi:hypothetical protein
MRRASIGDAVHLLWLCAASRLRAELRSESHQNCGLIKKADEGFDAMLTYRELLKQLTRLHPSRLNDAVTVFDPAIDEFQPVECTRVADTEHAQVDVGQFVLQLVL